MKRLLVRTLLLATVIGLGTLAVFEAKRLLRYDDPAEAPAIARREDDPRPIPLAPENPEFAPPADMPDFSQRPAADPPPRERFTAARPQPQRVYGTASAASEIPAGYTDDVPAGSPDEAGAPPVEDNHYAEPRRMQAEPAADAMPATGGDPFGIRRRSQSPRYAQQASATDDDAQALDPSDAAAPPNQRYAGRDNLPAGDEVAEDAGSDNFAPPTGLGRGGNVPAVSTVPGIASGDDDLPAEAQRPGDCGPNRRGHRPARRAAPRRDASPQCDDRETGAGRDSGRQTGRLHDHGTQPGQPRRARGRGARRRSAGHSIHRVDSAGEARPAGRIDLGAGQPQADVRGHDEHSVAAAGRGRDRQRGHAAFCAGASARTTATRPQLVLEAAAPSRVMIGTDLTLKIKLSNTGTGAATGVVLTETVPPGLKHPAGNELEFEVGTLKPGEHRELELALTAAQPGPLTNLLALRADADLAVETRTACEVIAPSLKVGVTGPKRRYLERSAIYSISVTNPGTAPAHDVELTAVLPKGLKFVEANNAGQFDPANGAVYWSLEQLPPGSTGTVTVTALPVEPGELKLHVQGRAKQGLLDELDETVVVEGIAAILFELVDVHDPIEVGGETSYEIRVINQGSKSASNVRVVALFPPQMQPVGAEGPARHVIDGQRVLFDPVGQLGPKADMTYTVKAKALAAGDLRLRVQVVTDENRTPITREESTRVYSEE